MHADTTLARQKLTEMRLKKKRKFKDRDDHQEEGEYTVTIGGDHDNGGGGDESHHDEVSDQAKEEEVPKIVKKKKKRVKIVDGETEEQRALRLLESEF